MATTVLVTGASGFLGSWITASALRAGLRVRGSVRGDNLTATNPKLAHLFSLPGAAASLELIRLDMTESASEEFTKAVRGCALVIHAASKMGVVKDAERDQVQPAIQGTLKVLEACAAADSGVQRVVITSSAITVGRSKSSAVVETRTGDDWNDDAVSDGYSRSKILAEKAAWDFYRARPHLGFALTTINPTIFFGPALSKDGAASSVHLVQMLVGPKRMPAMPRMAMGFADVRDVADAHVRAALAPRDQVAGKRFIVCERRAVWFKDIAHAIGAQFGKYDYQTPSYYIPNVVLRVAGLFSQEIGFVVPRLGILTEYDTEPARRVLGLQDRGLAAVMHDTVAVLIQQGLLATTPAFERRADTSFGIWKPSW